MRMRRCV